jgi:hypothetical protein
MPAANQEHLVLPPLVVPSVKLEPDSAPLLQAPRSAEQAQLHQADLALQLQLLGAQAPVVASLAAPNLQPPFSVRHLVQLSPVHSAQPVPLVLGDSGQLVPPHLEAQLVVVYSVAVPSNSSKTSLSARASGPGVVSARQPLVPPSLPSAVPQRLLEALASKHNKAGPAVLAVLVSKPKARPKPSHCSAAAPSGPAASSNRPVVHSLEEVLGLVVEVCSDQELNNSKALVRHCSAALSRPVEREVSLEVLNSRSNNSSRSRCSAA